MYALPLGRLSGPFHEFAHDRSDEFGAAQCGGHCSFLSSWLKMNGLPLTVTENIRTVKNCSLQ
jgi:hypothetical protein